MPNRKKSTKHGSLTDYVDRSYLSNPHRKGSVSFNQFKPNNGCSVNRLKAQGLDQASVFKTV